MSNWRRFIGILTSIAVLCAGVVVLETRAAADQGATAGNQEVSSHATLAVRPVAPSVKVPSGAPQVPEESATIRDDPTIAPDPKQSADNDVSFPNDI